MYNIEKKVHTLIMREIKTILLIFIMVFGISGCSIQKNTAKASIEQYFNNYNELSNDVINDLNVVVEQENLTVSQKELYKQVLKRQYQNLKYNIIDEYYNGNISKVSVNIEVYDLFKAQKQAGEYLKRNIYNFYDAKGNYDNNKYIDYKFNLMNTINDRVQYNLEINLIRERDTWIIKEITSEDLEKIHGIYNYEGL